VGGGVPLGDTLARRVKDEIGCRASYHSLHPLVKSIISKKRFYSPRCPNARHLGHPSSVD
jgi:hypothetical protein